MTPIKHGGILWAYSRLKDDVVVNRPSEGTIDPGEPPGLHEGGPFLLPEEEAWLEGHHAGD